MRGLQCVYNIILNVQGASVISSFDENNVDNFTEQCLMLMAYEIYVGRIETNHKVWILSVSHQKRLANSVDFL